jgi:hypothetical protein
VEELGALYDRFYGILYERQQRSQIIQEETERRAKASRARAAEVVTGLAERQSIEKGRVGLGPSPTLMDYDGFREFLAGMARWAISDSPTPPEKDNALLNVKNIRILVTAFGEGKILFRHGDMETRSQLITSLCDGYLDDGMLI